MQLNYKMLGKRIKEARNLMGISQSELAEYADLSVPYVCNIENAKKQASLNSLIRISNAMKITVDDLLCGNQKNNRTEYKNDILFIMEDCTKYESRIIYETLTSVKSALRNNANLLKIE